MMLTLYKYHVRLIFFFVFKDLGEKLAKLGTYQMRYISGSIFSAQFQLTEIKDSLTKMLLKVSVCLLASSDTSAFENMTLNDCWSI